MPTKNTMTLPRNCRWLSPILTAQKRGPILVRPRSLSLKRSSELSVTISSPSRSPKRRPTSVRSTTKNKLSTSPPNLSKLRLALNSPRGQYRNCKRRLTDWKMSSFTRRRNSRPSLMSLTKPSLKCPATNFSFFVSKNCQIAVGLFQYPSIQDHVLLQLFLQDCSLISLISTTALHKLLVTMPAPTHQNKTT